MTTKEKYREVSGDLLYSAREGIYDVIVHGCNCHGIMGAGIARQIATLYPEVYETDKSTKKGDFNKLGTLSTVLLVLPTIEGPSPVTFVNAYTQFHGGKNLDYTALRLCLRKVNRLYSGSLVGLPQIGCGIAGGDWQKVKEIIQEELKDCFVEVFTEYIPNQLNKSVV